MNSKANRVLVGRSFKMPETVKLELSNFMILPKASSVPNIFTAIFWVITTLVTLFSAVSALPCKTGKLNIFKNEGSAKRPLQDICLRPTVVTNHWLFVRATYAISGNSCFKVGARILGVEFQH